MGEQQESQRKKALSPDVKRRVWRLVLRSLPIPLIPGPELFDLVAAIRMSRSDLDRQVSEAIESLQRSSQVVSQLEEALAERSKRLIELRKEYERYSELAEVEEKQVEALVEQLEITLGKARGRERLFAIMLNFVIGLIFFVAGAVFSRPLQESVQAVWRAIFGG